MESFALEVQHDVNAAQGNSTANAECETSLFDIYRFVLSELDVPSQRALRQCSQAARSAHDREETRICVRSTIHKNSSAADLTFRATDVAASVSGILARGCRPDCLTLHLSPWDPEAQERGLACLSCFNNAGVSSVTRLTAQHFNFTAAAAKATVATAPALSYFSLSYCRLDHLPIAFMSRTRATLRHLSLTQCTPWPLGLPPALHACSNLEYLDVSYDHAQYEASGGDGGGGDGAADTVLRAAAYDQLQICRTVVTLTQLQSLVLDLRLPSYAEAFGITFAPVATELAGGAQDGGQGTKDAAATLALVRSGGAPMAAAAAAKEEGQEEGQRKGEEEEEKDPVSPLDPSSLRALAAATLAAGVAHLTRLSRLELGESGALPHPDWRLELLAGLARLPCLTELSWRRLECDVEALSALAPSTSLACLSVERLKEPGPLRAVALAAAAASAAAAAAAAEAERSGGSDPNEAAAATRMGVGARPSPAAAAAAAAATAAAAMLFRDHDRGGGSAAAAASSGALTDGTAAAPQPPPPLWRRLLLSLPPNLRMLRARYSGLGGVSLAALAALQMPSCSTVLELRNPKLEVGDADVEQPAGTRLLPEAALALGLCLTKLATQGSVPGSSAPQSGPLPVSSSSSSASRPMGPGSPDCSDSLFGSESAAHSSAPLHTLRIISESRQRCALAAPVGWAEGAGGGLGAAGGGHVPWLTSLGAIRGLRRLTLSGFMLGRVDAEVLARQLTGLEELYLVPLSSVSSAAVPVLRGMGLRRLVLPYERHA